MPTILFFAFRSCFAHICISLFLVSLVLSSAKADAGVKTPDLLLAKVYQFHTDIDIRDYWVSEKYDGVRAFWDGSRFISRQGNIYHAPAWFIKDFPHQPLDGELWIGRGQFERVVSTVQKAQPDDQEWRAVRFMVYELPEGDGTFSDRLATLRQIIAHCPNPYLVLVPQYRLQNRQLLLNKLSEVTQDGAEGLMLHRAGAAYATGRSEDLLKVKNYQDAEATVIKILPGKGKYQHMMGSLLVKNTQGKLFKIGSGFSDKQRREPPAIGTLITYKYYGLTKKGIPRFASFLRVRHDRKQQPTGELTFDKK